MNTGQDRVYYSAELTEEHVRKRMIASMQMSQTDRQRLAKLEARVQAGKPLTRTERFELMNLTRLHEQQKFVDAIADRHEGGA